MSGDSTSDDAFTAYVAVARDELGRLAYLMCGDWHQAEDIVQNVLGRVYVRWERICRGGDPHAYVRRCLVNGFLDERRRPWRREHAVAEMSAEHDHAAPPAPERDEELRAAIAALPPRQRTVVVLRYVEDRSVGEVATELGISPGTVKSQAARALDTIRARIEPGAPARRGGME